MAGGGHLTACDCAVPADGGHRGPLNPDDLPRIISAPGTLLVRQRRTRDASTGCRARGTTSPLPETIDRPQAALSMTTTLRNNRLHSGRRCWPGLRFLKAEENDVERRQDDQGQERRHEQTRP